MFKGKREFNFMKKNKKKGATSGDEHTQSGEWVNLRKSLHMTIRIASVVILSVTILASLVVFIMGILQVRSPNAGAAFPSDQLDHYAYNKLNTDCSSEELKKYHPLRYEVLTSSSKRNILGIDADVAKRQDPTSSSTGTASTSAASTTGNSVPPSTPATADDGRFEYCGWDARNTWIRSVTVIITIGWAGLLIGRLRKRSPASNSAAIWQKPRRVLRVLIALTIALGGWWGIIMIIDGSDVNYSRKWCLDKATAANNSINCDYLAFVVMVLLDMCMLILWGLVVGVMLLRYKFFNKYMQLEEEDEMEMG